MRDRPEDIWDWFALAGCALALLCVVIGAGCAPKKVPPGQAKKNWGPPIELPGVPEEPFAYICRVWGVVDGDTVDCLLYLGFDTFKHERFRLAGIDAWEVYSGPKEEREKGAIARAALTELLFEADKIIVKTNMDRVGKFGRPIGTFIADGVDVQDWLVEHGHAVRKDY